MIKHIRNWENRVTWEEANKLAKQAGTRLANLEELKAEVKSGKYNSEDFPCWVDGPAARGYYYFGDNVRQVVNLGYGPSFGLGVAIYVPDKNHKHVWKCECGKKRRGKNDNRRRDYTYR